MTSLRLNALVAALAFALLSAPADAAPSVDVAAEHSAGALTVHLSGHDAKRRRVFVAALATTAGECPAQPTAAARLVTARPKRDGAWTKRLRLTPGSPGLAARAGDHPRRVVDDGAICAWQLRSRSLDDEVLAAGTTADDGSLWSSVRVVAWAVGGSLVAVGVGMLLSARRRRRCRQVAGPGLSAATAELPPLPPPGPRRADLAFGTDGSTRWDGAPPDPEQIAVMDYRDVRLGDPRLN